MENSKNDCGFFKGHYFKSFLVNFLGVALGVALTLTGEALITEYGEQKRAKEILELVKEELQVNVTGMEQFMDVLKKEHAAIDYLLAHRSDIKSIPYDSLELYGARVASAPLMQMDNIANNLLQSSDFQNGISDNSLKLSIVEAYLTLKTSAESFNNVAELKTKLILDAQTPHYKQLLSKRNIFDRELWEEFLFCAEGVFLMQQEHGGIHMVLDAMEANNRRVSEVIVDIDEYLQ